jgi:hypothetical protein
MDKFPEAFKRFKQKVHVKNIKTFGQLTLAFGSWSGKKWRGTFRQMDALAVQAKRLRIPLEGHKSRQQQVRAIFIQTAQQREAQWREKFSRGYVSFQQWHSETGRTTAYERRVTSYMRNHPSATLSEARGHKTKRS